MLDQKVREQKILSHYLSQKRLKKTKPRWRILEAFLSTGSHVSAEDLHSALRQKDTKIGFSTIYRTLKLLTDCGLAKEVNLGDGRVRFERVLGKTEHGHLICTACGKTEEFSTISADRILRRVSFKTGFKVEGHRFEVYGLCKRCH